MKIYLDTNAFYFFFFEDKKFSEGLKKAFKKIQAGKWQGITSCLTLDELAYSILLRLIEKKHKKYPLNIIRENRSVILEFIDEVHAVFDTIFSFNNIEIIDVSLDTVSFIPIMMEEKLLLPRDSIHLRTMLDNNCTKILSTDTDFDHLEEIERVMPENL